MTAQPRTDPAASLPAAVRAAGKLADDKHKAVYSKNNAPEPKPGDDNIKIADAPATPEPAAATPTPEPTPAPAPEPVTSTGNPPAENWEHRYNSMKGRYDRSQDQIRALSDQISQLQVVIATMQQPTPQPADTLPPDSLLTPQEETDYGAEFLSVVGKKAKQIVNPEVASLKAELAAVKQQLANVGGYVQTSARQRMLDTLNEKVPSWPEVNENDKFIAWLQLPDAYSGVIRHELLKAAYERNDTPRVLAFFTGFLAEEAAVDPAPGGLDAVPAAPTPPAKVPLESLAAPGRAKSTAAPSAPAEKPIITRSQIQQFYLDVAANKYRGREQEKDRLEKMIFDAEKEGRIR